MHLSLGLIGKPRVRFGLTTDMSRWRGAQIDCNDCHALKGLTSYSEFIQYIETVPLPADPVLRSLASQRTPQACYLLGWMVGDFTKHFSPTNPGKMRVSLELTMKHLENLELGNYVSKSLNLIGVPCRRIKDSPVRERNPNPKFRWLSKWSTIITWMYLKGLGLDIHQRTSHDQVSMEWLLGAPSELRLWFIRGLADSDGSVNFRNNNVAVVTCPNSEFVKQLFQSLGVHALIGTSNGCGLVIIGTSDAARIGCFNPEVDTHRRKILIRLTEAKRFHRRWPAQLRMKVEELIAGGYSSTEIAHELFDENHIYVKTTSIKRHMNRLKSHGRDSNTGPPAYKAGALPG